MKIDHWSRGLWITIICLAVILFRFSWLFGDGKWVLPNDLKSLFPSSNTGSHIETLIDRQNDVQNQVVMMIQGKNQNQVDEATDAIADHMAELRNIQSIIDGPDLAMLENRAQFLIDYRDKLLSDSTHERLKLGLTEQVKFRQQQLEQFPPLNMTHPIKDPVGLIDDFISERAGAWGAQNIQSDGLYLSSTGPEPTNFIFISLAESLAESELTAEEMDSLVDQLKKLEDEIEDQHAVSMTMSGFTFHAVENRQSTSQEISLMSLCALLFTVLLFIFAVRSWLALLFSLIALSASMISGLVFAEVLTGLPHMISLIMATTAIGICIDFSIHYWMHQRVDNDGYKAIQEIRRGMTTSMFTTVCGFIVISLVTVTVLSQSAVFIIGALVMNWAIVMWVYPSITLNARKPIADLTRFIPEKGLTILIVGIGLVTLYGLVAKLHVDDNPHKLGQVITELRDNDRSIVEQLGMDSFQSEFIITGTSEQQLLETEELFLNALRPDQMQSVSALSRLIPSYRTQLSNQSILREQWDKSGEFVQADLENLLGVKPLPLFPENEKLYDLNSIIHQSWAEAERSAFLGCISDECASVIRADETVHAQLKDQCMEVSECEVFSSSSYHSNTLGKFRKSMCFALIGMLCVIAVILGVRYKLKSVRLMLVPLFSITVGIASVGWFNLPLTAFSIAALFPLVGLSVDYAIFTTEVRHNGKVTQIAILISALTTTFSFALLSFSETPAVQYFALPVAFGIPAAWLAVWISRSGLTKENA